MRSDYLKHLVDLSLKVEDGILPDSAIQRIFYIGHQIIDMADFKIREPQFRCLDCKLDFQAEKGICPQCNQKDYCLSEKKEDIRVYQIDFSPIVTWQCKFCQHIWTSEDGEVCPQCNKKWDYKE